MTPVRIRHLKINNRNGCFIWIAKDPLLKLEQDEQTTRGNKTTIYK
jgi:hypothetical protein